MWHGWLAIAGKAGFPMVRASARMSWTQSIAVSV